MAPRKGPRAPLDPFHSHFIFVDNGITGSKAWGSEIMLRNNLENYIARVKKCPIVMLVMNGGPGTMATILSAAFSGTPIVVLADSGGAAAQQPP